MDVKKTSDCLRLALMYEVAATPKPGCIDRNYDHSDTSFCDFISSAVAVSRCFEECFNSSLGEVILGSTKNMVKSHSGQNTHFGAILLNAPLYLAAVQVDDFELDNVVETAGKIVEASSVDDAIKFYESFRHVEVGGLRDDIEELDAESREAILDISRNSISFYDLMELSVEYDGVAREVCRGFERTIEGFGYLDEGPIDNDSLVRCFLNLLTEPDTHIVKVHSREKAELVSQQAREIIDEGFPEGRLQEFDSRLNEEGVSPGTTADILSSSIFMSLLDRKSD
ncbi:Triphosphoribosyl-dephospho-CoA synthetase, CitG [Methanonatronarchaeum thermophilum]|uniref:Triphosphoribosyl-dephospho-CoA synthetase, CitG n=1 Tax=Methanonatronarchaeum thermophilum TaxID=1927129 RepID=A0A1Y3GAQ8_9EURY|nr:triphosphoribosyl-dephospho-CoA synthase [Methanonatronarchaeum thermophilum]OUJ18508.1 Triphosphoribosyl-dephospho-CoA synthetase, CitG [Methanonatronarchaeum thermophilum]